MNTSAALKHNGANTNLYCDGKTVFVTNCPACDDSYEKRMRPRWARAKELCLQLNDAGFTETAYGADLWKIWVNGVFHERRLRVEEEGR